MFGTVRIGPYEAAILNWLRDFETKCPIAVWLAEFERDEVPSLNPHLTKFSGVNFVVFYTGRLIFYVKLDKRPVPKEFALLTLQEGRPLYSIVRQFKDGKEIGLMKRMMAQPSMQRVLNKWDMRRDLLGLHVPK